MACAMDSKCKAFRHSSKNGFGFLCSNLDANEMYDDWKVCEFDSGEKFMYSSQGSEANNYQTPPKLSKLISNNRLKLLLLSDISANCTNSGNYSIFKCTSWKRHCDS